MCYIWLGNGICGRDFGRAFDYQPNMIPQYDMAAKRKPNAILALFYC